MRNTHTSQSDRRRAYTMVELVTVMGIIAVLASLATYAVASFVANARVSATETLVLKIDRLIASRREAFDRYIIRNDKRAVWIEAYTVGSTEPCRQNVGPLTVRRDLQQGPMVRHEGRQRMPRTLGVIEVAFAITL